MIPDHPTARLAILPLLVSGAALVVLWARGLPHDFKYRTGVFRWRS